MKQQFMFSIFCAMLLFSGTGFSQEKSIEYYRGKAPFTFPEVKAPVFPDKDFVITNYGGVGDGVVLNTKAINDAIQACSVAGGGRVVVPAGLWLTGPIKLQSNVNLHLEHGALLSFSGDFSLYPMAPASAKSTTITTTPPISGDGLKNIAITGSGVIDGNGQYWRPVKKEKFTASQWKKLTTSGGVLSKDAKIWWPSEEAMNGEQFLKDLKKSKQKPMPQEYEPARVFLRPHMVFLTNCENVLIEDVTLRNSPKFVFYPNNCTNVILKNATVFNDWFAQNGDGIDISACKNVVVYQCAVSVGDDGICMKSSRGAKDTDEIANLQNVLVAECVVYHGHGGFVIGSNTDGRMENIFVTNCNFIGTDIGVRVKSNAGRGGLVKNIFVENIYMKDIVDEAISFDTYYDDVPTGTDANAVRNTKTDKIPVFKDFHLKNIYCKGAETGLFMRGLPEDPIKDIFFENVIISAKKDKQIENAEPVLEKSVQFVVE